MAKYELSDYEMPEAMRELSERIQRHRMFCNRWCRQECPEFVELMDKWLTAGGNAPLWWPEQPSAKDDGQKRPWLGPDVLHCEGSIEGDPRSCCDFAGKRDVSSVSAPQLSTRTFVFYVRHPHTASHCCPLCRKWLLQLLGVVEPGMECS